ncbi:MAG: hypothetical protein IT548_13375 [Alphaproteobacteria bacterium]|nr:hypothetical protein [Alphaproteobacteria bacterium]
MLITGDDQRNNLLGTADADTMNGLALNDTLRGSDGIDTLNGGDGDDILFSVNDPIDHDSFDSPTTNYAAFGDGQAEVLNGEAGDDELVGDLFGLYDGGLGDDHAFVSMTEAAAAVSFVYGGGAGISYSFVMGGAARGTMTGVETVDLYGSAFGDTISLAGGNDSVQAFAGNDTVNGNLGNDELRGGLGNDLLNGGAGRDTLAGGAGLDSLDGGDSNDVLFAGANPGRYTTFDDPATDFTAFGDGEADTLLGGSGSDDLVGDHFAFYDGGTGTADTAFVSFVEATAAMTFTYGGEADTAYAFVTGGAARGTVRNVESFVLYGTDFGDTITLHDGGDKIQGNGGNDTLSGMDGRDTLAGGDGADLLLGGTGNDVLLSASSPGNFTVFDKPDVDYDGFGDGAQETLDGGDGNDNLVGDYYATYLAGTGADRAFVSFTEAAGPASFTYGGAAATAYSFFVGGVAYGSAQDVENFDIYGSESGDAFNMHFGDDRIEAMGGNDTLNGNEGDDVLRGGSGNDTINGGLDDDELGGNVGLDTINGDQGDDIIFALVDPGSYDRFDGRSLDQTLFGNGLAERLGGGDGNDRIVGDFVSMIDGGSGGDRAYISMFEALAAVSFAYGGAVSTDYAFSMSGQVWGKVRNVENFDLYGSEFGDTLTTHDGADRIQANDGADTVDGGAGDDILRGGAGDDSVLGGEGHDTLGGGDQSDSLSGGNGNDVLFAVAEPVDYATFEDSSTDYRDFGDGSADSLDGGAGDDRLLGDHFARYLGGAGIDRAYVSLYEAVAGVTLAVGASATTAYNFVVDGIVHGSVTGVEAFDIYGSGYGDALTLGAGDDHVQALGGNDTLLGGGGQDVLHGGDGDDRLDGGAGNDTLAGGLGNDTYINPTASDLIIEAADGGSDTVQSNVTTTLAGYVNIENIVLAGAAAIDATGNEGDNALTGNAGANALTGGGGNDTLSGNAGADTLTGGLGNDVYVNVDGDSVVELAGQGTDTIQSNISFSLVPFAAIERLMLTGAALTGTGNGLANLLNGNTAANTLSGGDGNDTLNGATGNDTLDGGAGLDQLNGGVGNDTYLNPTGDTILEAVGQGTDTVLSDVSFSLAGAANVERLTLTGTASDGTGNALDNLLTGNAASNVLNGGDGNDILNDGAGDDRLNGGLGADILFGGAGADRLTPGTDSNVDIIRATSVSQSTGVLRDIVLGMDLNGEDVFDLPVVPTGIAAAVTIGTLNEASFDADLVAAISAAKMGAGQAVLFNPSAGTADYGNTVYLIVDANGVAGYQAGKDYVFQLQGMSGTLEPADFF